MRSTEFLKVQHGVVIPLLFLWEEECVSPKEFSVFAVAGRAAAAFYRGGRGAMCKERKHKTRNFDSTRGYPGEDIAPE